MRIAASIAITLMIGAWSMAASTGVRGEKMTDVVFIIESTVNTTAGGAKTTSYVGQHKTVVQGPNSLLIIDYGKLQLLEYQPSVERCDRYPLLDEKSSGKQISQEERFRQEMATQLGTAAVEATTAIPETKGFRPVAIHWGGRINLHRTVAPPSVAMYGRRFAAGRDLYLVNDTYEGLDVLLEYGKRRDSVFRLNPLLRRLDISGQVSLLTGVPVEKTNGHGIVEKFEIFTKGSVDSYPSVPGACQ